MKVELDQFNLVMLGVAPVKQLKQNTGDLPGMAVHDISVVVIFTALT